MERRESGGGERQSEGQNLIRDQVSRQTLRSDGKGGWEVGALSVDVPTALQKAPPHARIHTNLLSAMVTPGKALPERIRWKGI